MNGVGPGAEPPPRFPLSSAAGLFFWSIVSANWSFRCATSLSGLSRLPDKTFLRKWLWALCFWSGASLRYWPEVELVLIGKALSARNRGWTCGTPSFGGCRSAFTRGTSFNSGL